MDDLNFPSEICPNKIGYILENQAPFINNKTNKEIMKRSRLRNKFLHSRSDVYIQQKPKLLRQSDAAGEKSIFLCNLNIPDENKIY